MIPSHNPPFKPGKRIALLDLAPELITLICKSSEDWGAVFALKKVGQRTCMAMGQNFTEMLIIVRFVAA
jgi:hypothetical protein